MGGREAQGRRRWAKEGRNPTKTPTKRATHFATHPFLLGKTRKVGFLGVGWVKRVTHPMDVGFFGGQRWKC
jgi:hypothetical protein